MKPSPILQFHPFRCAACIPFRTYFLKMEQFIRDARAPPIRSQDSLKEISVARHAVEMSSGNNNGQHASSTGGVWLRKSNEQSRSC